MGENDEPRAAEIDKQLKEFLDAAHRERAAGHTLANIVIMQRSQGAEIKVMKDDIAKHDARLARHGRELKALKSITQYDGEADTGQHDLAEIKNEVNRVREEREAAVWWRRRVFGWVVAAVGVLLLQVLTLFLSKVAFK